MTMPPILKLAALIVTIIGLLTAMELATLTSKQFKPTPIIKLHNFSNILGYFPATVHRLAPKLNLVLGQTMANQLVDQSWFEAAGPKGLASTQAKISTLISDAQRGIIKTYLVIFLITTGLATLLASA